MGGIAGVFAHAGWMHLLENVAILLVFGPRVWRRLGSWCFLALFLLGGAAANQFAALLLDRPVIGASGAAAAVMGAYLVLFPQARFGALLLAPLIVLWAGLQVAFAAIGAGFAGVAWPAHIAGFAIGLAFARLLRKRLKAIDLLQSSRTV